MVFPELRAAGPGRFIAHDAGQDPIRRCWGAQVT
jgi:hypothetical protein